MNMQDLSDKMDAAVHALLQTNERDQAEALLIRTAANLLDKINDRDIQIRVLRSQLDEITTQLTQAEARLNERSV